MTPAAMRGQHDETDGQAGQGGPRKDERMATPETDTLMTSELRSSQKLVALGQLAAVVAHELGNPLSIISSSLQYLHERLVEKEDPAADFTATALANVDRMHGLLRSMLDFAAVERPERRRVQVNDTLRELVRFTSAECAKRSIRVELSLEADLPAVTADPSGITQICLNILKNTFDALAGRAGRLSIRSSADRARGRVVVELENDGPPIPDEAMAHLFRPFNTTKATGTGLGLYVSRQIAREHGGELRAESSPGGARFSLTLPVWSD